MSTGKRDLWLRVLIVLGLVGVFVTIAFGATASSRVSGVDMGIAEWVAGVRTPALNTVFWVLTVIGNTGVKILLVILAVVVWLIWGQPRAAAVLAGSMGLGYLVVETVKRIAERVRPPGATALIATPHSYSFPSGHAFSGLLFFALSGLLIAAVTRNRTVAWTAIVSGFAVGLAVGASRVYLGVHWASDVAASWVLAVAWLVLTWSVALKGGLTPEFAHPSGLSRRSAILATAALAAVAVGTVVLGTRFDPLL